MKVIIDGRFVLDAADLHRRLAAAFGYGPNYRPGLCTLRDRLAAGDPRPLELVWTNAGSIRMALGASAYEEFVAVLERVAADDAGRDWAQRLVFRLFD